MWSFVGDDGEILWARLSATIPDHLDFETHLYGYLRSGSVDNPLTHFAQRLFLLLT